MIIYASILIVCINLFSGDMQSRNLVSFSFVCHNLKEEKKNSEIEFIEVFEGLKTEKNYQFSGLF